MHFYECGKNGNVLHVNSARCGSDVGIVASSRQRIGDGIAFYRSANDVILTEGINGVFGVQYCRFIHRLHRDPARKRTLLRRREGWSIEESGGDEDAQPQTMFAQTNHGEIDFQTIDSPSVEEGNIQTAVSEGASDDVVGTPPSDDAMQTSALEEIAGLNPFSSAWSESEFSMTDDRVKQQ